MDSIVFFMLLSVQVSFIREAVQLLCICMKDIGFGCSLNMYFVVLKNLFGALISVIC